MIVIPAAAPSYFIEEKERSEIEGLAWAIQLLQSVPDVLENRLILLAFSL